MRKIKTSVMQSIQENKIHKDFEKILIMIQAGNRVVVADDGSKLRLDGEFDVLDLESLVNLFDTKSMATKKTKDSIYKRIDEDPITEADVGII